MAKEIEPLSEQLRQAMVESGVTRYRISKVTGIDQAALSRFAHGERGLSMEAMDAIGEYLGLRIVFGRKPRRKD
jgi:transcriptional regulator with XRE-family HTH domain